MSEVIFRCPCPASGCDDGEIRGWYHGDCPSSSNYYLSENGFVRCDNCNKKFTLFSRKWKGNSCTHDYRKTDLQRIMYCLSKMQIEQNLPKIMMINLINSLIEQSEDD